MAKKPTPLLWSLLIAFISVLAVTFSGIVYTNYVAKQNNRQWCDVLITIDEAYEQVRNNPNTSPVGRNIAEQFHKLRIDFGC